MILFAGALLGFISVAFGAYVEHGMRASLTNEQLHILLTAVRYNQVHAIMTCAIGLILLNKKVSHPVRALRWSGALFITGTTLFSFSLYVSLIFHVPIAMKLAPLGGIVLMTAWLALCIAGILAKKAPDTPTSP